MKKEEERGVRKKGEWKEKGKKKAEAWRREGEIKGEGGDERGIGGREEIAKGGEREKGKKKER